MRTASDSIQLKFSIKDTNNNDTLDGAVILFYDALHKTKIGGFAYFFEISETYKLPKSSDAILVEIHYLGCESYSRKIIPDANYDYMIKMECSFDKVISGEKWAYDIIDAASPNLLRLKRKGGETVETFKKIKPKK